MADLHNEFEDLEQDLRESLATRSAPEGFAENVLANIAAREARKAPRPAPIYLWRRAIAAVLLAAALLAAALLRHQRQQRIAGERARSQVMLALRITGSTLDAIQQKIQRTTKEAQP